MEHCLRRAILYIVIAATVVAIAQAQQWNKTLGFIGCGVNYIQKSAKITFRDSVIAGNEMPVTFAVSEFPNDCWEIKAAYVWWSVSYSDTANKPAFVTIINPDSTNHLLQAKLIGSDKDKCWPDFDEKGTRSYRADVTNAIVGNGNYYVSVNQPKQEIDGITLLIIYQDNQLDYQGNFFLSDGLITMQNNNINDTTMTLTDISVGNELIPNTTEGFVIVSDLQINAVNPSLSNFTVTVNEGTDYEAIASLKKKFWNSEFFPIADVFPGQKSLTYKIGGANDCYSIITTGVYFKTKSRLCPQKVRITVASDTIVECRGKPVTLSVKGAPFYEWVHEDKVLSTDSVFTFIPSTGGLYTVKAYSEDRCRVDSVNVSILLIDNPEARAGIDTTICRGNYVKIGMGPQKDCSYNWKPVFGLDNPLGSNCKASPDSTTEYVLTITNKNGCFDTDTVIVSVVPELKIIPAEDITVCPGKKFTLVTMPYDGTKPYYYKWDFLDTTNSAPEVTLFKSKRFVAEISDNFNCVVWDTIDVTVQPGFIVDIGDDKHICPGNSTVLGGSISGGTAPFLYLWKPESGLSSTSVANPVATSLETTKYYLTVVDGEGCYGFDTVTVFVNDSLKNDYPERINICSGNRVTIYGTVNGGTKPYEYKWTPAAGLSSDSIGNPVLLADKSMTYYIVITDSLGCSIEDSVIVHVFDKPEFELGPDRNLCKGSALSIGSDVKNGLPPYSYKWHPDTGLDTSDKAFVNASPEITTKYFLTVTDENGCIAVDSVVVTVNENPTPHIAAIGSTELCACDSLLIECNGSYSSFLWSEGSTGPSIYAKKSNAYYVTVTDGNGCTGVSNSIKVDFLSPRIELNLPANVSVKIGEKFKVPLTINFDDNFFKCNRYNYSGLLSFNKTILLPANNTPLGYTDEIFRYVPFSGSIKANNDTLKVFEFYSALGNAPETSIEIKAFIIDDCNIPFNAANSFVLISDMCTRGDSTRLLVPDRKPVITSIFPLPAIDNLILGLYSEEEGEITISLTNLYGTVFCNNKFKIQKGNSSVTLSLGDLPPGVYYLSSDNGNGLRHHKIVIL